MSEEQLSWAYGGSRYKEFKYNSKYYRDLTLIRLNAE